MLMRFRPLGEFRSFSLAAKRVAIATSDALKCRCGASTLDLPSLGHPQRG